MASLRKASAYSKKKVRPFTRTSRNRKKAYIKTIPGSKIVKFESGKKKTNHKFKLKFVSGEKVQIRDNALESCRMLVNKILEREIPGQFHFSVNVYPHHILRENKTAAGAGADRLSSGMKHSFGITIGRAAIVNPGKSVFTVQCANQKAVRAARAALNKVKPKVPCKGKVVFEEFK
jgi:large subunit ribosomal protein L10e